MKIKLFMLALLIVCTGPAVAGTRITAVNEDGIPIHYILEGDKAEVTFGPNEKYSGDIKIPSLIEHNGQEYHVISVGDYAFNKCGELKNVILPATTESIGYHAFYECGMLEEILIPDRVSKIGQAAFCKSKLERVDLSPNLKAIEDSTFFGCQFSKIDFFEGLERIGERAFSECLNIDYFDLPVSLNDIGDEAFSHCSSLRIASMGINNKGKYGDGILAYCNKLQYILTPISNEWEEYRTLIINGVLKAVAPYGTNQITICSLITSVGKYCFTGCHDIESVELPVTLLAIKDYAFHDSGIKSISIPKQVETIGSNAFSSCPHLKDVTLSNSIREIGDYAFDDCPDLETVRLYTPNPATVITGDEIFSNAKKMQLFIPMGSKILYQSATPWSQFGKLVEMNVEVCEMPEITLSEKTLKAVSPTENSKVITTVSSKDAAFHQTGNEALIDLMGQYDVSSYATAPGMERSGIARATLYLLYVIQGSIGVEQITPDNRRALLIRNEEDRMEISGCKEGESVTVVTLAGEILYNKKAGGDKCILPVAAGKGNIYIVKVGEISVKYQMR